MQGESPVEEVKGVACICQQHCFGFITFKSSTYRMYGSLDAKDLAVTQLHGVCCILNVSLDNHQDRLGNDLPWRVGYANGTNTRILVQRYQAACNKGIKAY